MPRLKPITTRNSNCGLRIADYSQSEFGNRPARGLTLIELLVTIVILVTLLAGVLPAISPNNEARKIREASRQLTSLFAQAQAQAARDGRPVGVGFSDPDGDGMALEAYIISEPPPFTGFSSDAAVTFHWAEDDPLAPNANKPIIPDFLPPLLNAEFGHGVGGEGMVSGDSGDALPPQMVRGGRFDPDDISRMEADGDIIQVGQELFEIVENDCDDMDDTDSNPDTEDIPSINGGTITYLQSQQIVTVRWLTWKGRPSLVAPQGGKAYRIRRRPTTRLTPSRTAAPPLQFPRGVGIDLDPSDGNLSLGVVFAANGAVDSVYLDGDRFDVRKPFYILLGRTENGNPPTVEQDDGDLDIDYSVYDFRGGISDDDLAQRRREVNLLNADSRWVVITPAGRVLGADNYMFDPRDEQFTGNLSGTDVEQQDQQRDRQRDAAQQYANRFENQGGR